MVDLQEAPVDGHYGQGEGGGHEGLVVLQAGVLSLEEEGQALFLSGQLRVCRTVVVVIAVVVVVVVVVSVACVRIAVDLADVTGAVAATSTATTATATTRAAASVVVGDVVVATAATTATARRNSMVVHALNIGF